MREWVLILALAWFPAWAAIDSFEFKDERLARRYQDLIDELRCPKCQNQNIAGSNAPLAMDLRQKVYDMLNVGESDRAITDYMVQRYGDFITYRPPLKPLTWPLWFGPGLLIVLVGVGLALWIRRRSQAPAAGALSAAERARLEALLRQSEEQP